MVMFSFRIGHDNYGKFAGWYLSHVTIRATNLQSKLKFSAERWIDEKEADKKLEVELYPDDNKEMKDFKSTTISNTTDNKNNKNNNSNTNNSNNNDNSNSNIEDISGELEEI